ncbi:LLM class F420-dependent oxidoreductase [Ktedonosporobacter rubrisoli]|uniref:LLM class F420-dependent oxidoreductase n=1 Tax=Ktedonosporobacter rubrisoli TaxID=2509675 RepID=A0A4P6JM21_KTERU|nr:LLM class F420-dependent oxidoreductase [Ktedonosporobacter rubrisoli]QBD76143.1 LLM class F420-dependent oxidoreductase [Ktedonosporobacter rubrisoli]
MRLGLQIPNFTWPGGPEQLSETYTRIVKQAEQVGFYSLWTMDHVLLPPRIGPIEGEVMEGWNALTFAAALTERIKLGVLVSAVTFRYPGLLVKSATTLDVLSRGRSYFGLGAAWYEEESPAYGIPFPRVKERFERLEETLQIAHQMWSGDERPYAGKHYKLARPLNSPQPLQKPHPPILIAGGGELKTLNLVARYGDACNIFSDGDSLTIRRKLEALREHCETLGRPYEQIEKTTHYTLLNLTADGRDGSFSPAAAIEHFAQLAEQGIDQEIFSVRNVHDPRTFELLAEIIAAVEKIPVAGR